MSLNHRSLPALSLGTVLKAALIAGLAAGLTVAVFHLIVTEPLIDRAVTLEEQSHAGQGAHEAPLVSRDAQHKGLVLGYILYGLTWALLFGVTYQLAQRWLPARNRMTQGLVFAFLAYWALALLPFLKYPANPPGIGDPETIGARQALYFGFLILSVMGAFLSVWIGRTLGRRYSGSQRTWLFTVALMAAFGLLLYAAMPSTVDEMHMPVGLVSSFRALSLAGLTLFWLVLGLLFGRLLSGPPRLSTGG